MTDWLGIEAVIQPALDYIAGDAGTEKVAEIENRDWAGIGAPLLTLDPFATVRMADPDNEREPEFPALIAVPIGDTPVPGAGRTLIAATHTVIWVVMAQHAGTSTVRPGDASRRYAMRLAIAVRELLGEMHAHEATPYHWTLGTMRYGDTYTRGSGEYLADVQLETTIEHRS